MTDAELAPFRWLRLLHGGAWCAHAARVPEHPGLARERLAAAVEEVNAGLVGRHPGPG